MCTSRLYVSDFGNTFPSSSLEVVVTHFPSSVKDSLIVLLVLLNRRVRGQAGKFDRISKWASLQVWLPPSKPILSNLRGLASGESVSSCLVRSSGFLPPTRFFVTRLATSVKSPAFAGDLTEF